MINDFIRVYKKSVEETITVLKKSPQVVLIPLIGSLLLGLINGTMMRTGMLNNRFSYLITNLIYALILSGVFYEYERAINYSSLDPYTFMDGVQMYVIDVYIVRFILYVISLLLQMFVPIPVVGRYITIGIYLILNPYSEIIYIRGSSQDLYDIRYLWNFLVDNWYIWIPQMAVMIYVFFPVYGGIPNPISIYLPGSIAVGRVDLMVVVTRLLLGVYLVFRGVLFKQVYRSSRRSRDFKELV